MKTHSALVALAAIVASLCAVFATGCISDTSQGGKGRANVQIRMDAIGALGKSGAVSEIRMKRLALSLRSPGETTRRDTIVLTGNGQRDIFLDYANLSSKKTWTLEATAYDSGLILIYRDSVKFTVPPEGIENVNLHLYSLYSMLRARIYPISDSVTRCQLWVNGSVVTDSSFPAMSLASDTLTLIRDYVKSAPDTGYKNLIVMKVYGNWFGTVGALLYEGETTLRVVTGQNVSYNLTLNWVAPLAPIGQGKINVTLGAIGTLTFDTYLDDRFWQNVGDTLGVSAGLVTHVSMARDSADRMHVAYSDETSGDKATVVTWNGSTWATLGTAGFTPGVATNLSLSHSSTTPYVSFRDSANGNKASVMRWNGASWVPVGSLGISQGGARFVSMVVAPDGTPLIAYQDVANGEKLSVARWSGSAWEYLGGPGSASADKATYVSLAVSPNGTPYVAFRDEGAAGSISVVKWDGSAWGYLGTRGFYVGDAYNMTLAISSTGTPNLAFQGNKQDYLLSVVRWEGGTWNYLGKPGFSPSTGADNLTMALSNDGTPYVAYRLKTEGGGATADVMKWTGSLWQSIRGTKISKGYADSYSLSFSSDGTPYMAYRDYPLGARLIVMSFRESCCLGYADVGGFAKRAAQ